MKKGTILSIDDDANLQVVVGQYLESDGYNVVSAESAKVALEKVDSMPVHVILLDLVLPDMEGISLLPQLKSKSNAGIIVVSGKSDTTEKIVCLEMGADDYITKPFEMRELSARIKAVVRRANPDTQATSSDSTGLKKAEIINFGNGWRLDRTQFQLFDKDNKSAELTTGEFQLLDALVSSSNRVLTREHLFDITRDGRYDSYDRAIDIQIARLRKKINDDTKSPQVIKTIRGVGYMFCSDVKSA